MTQENQNEAIGRRTQVAKSSKTSQFKNKIQFLGVILVCLGIGLSGLMAKPKKKLQAEEEDKENTSMQLNQNMA